METDLVDLLIKGGIGALITIGFRILTGPMLEAITGAFVVSLLGWIPQPGREFKGLWLVTWAGESENFPGTNRDVIYISHFWKFVTFRANFPSSRGEQTYEFFGRWAGNALSGRWYDTKSTRGYHGTFHIVLQQDCRLAQGQWLGFSSSGYVRNGEFVLQEFSARRVTSEKEDSSAE